MLKWSIPMRRALALTAVILTVACGSPTGPDGGGGQRLTVIERSATTISVRWEPAPNATSYTVDHMAGGQCSAHIPHNNELVVGNVTSANIEGLTPSTDYQIHVHRLVGQAAQMTEWNYVLVRTLPPGSGPQSVTQPDYTSCAGSP